MTDFITIDSYRAAEIKRMPVRRGPGGPRPLSAVSQRLLDGEMVFTRDKRWKPAYQTFRKRGRKIHTRRADGGIYYWTSLAA